MNARKVTLVLFGGFLLAEAAFAQEAYYHSPIGSLTLTEGALPPAGESGPLRWQQVPALQPYAVLDGEGEVYVGGDPVEPWRPHPGFARDIITIRVAKPRDITGRLFVPKADYSGMTPLKFTVAAAKAKPESRDEFLKAKESHYQRLLERNIPGAAWFRHQEVEAAKALGKNAPPRPGANRRDRPTPFEPEDTYELFTGGRALSENLQLDRLLTTSGSGKPSIDITNLAGITIHEMDWKPLIKDIKPEPDPLATHIPFDQHAIFFPTFKAITEMTDEVDADGTPVLQLLEPRSEDANARGRYQKQLCLELNEVSRLLGPQVINSVALTGSDPYLRIGTDLGILFETKSSGLLKTFIAARQAEMKKMDSDLKSVSGEIEGVGYVGVISADRAVSSYVAALDEIVFVSNSIYQLGRLLAVAKGKTTSLAAQDEYKFFRDRYARGAKGEAAFVVLTDATIRRWCGPQWRIGNSRRTRVGAALAEAQAAHLDELMHGTVKPGPIPPISAEAGEVQINRHRVFSPVWGTLDFMTPIGEMAITQVTQAEADAYNRWRDLYQENWRKFFDPIAIRFSMDPRQLSAEITVMPLISGTDYRQFINLTRGSQIGPDSGDRHPEALLHLAMSLNASSGMIKDAGNFLTTMNPSLKANPLGWIGQSIAVYADQDPFWEKLRKAEKAESFLEKNYHQLPVALQCEVKNPLGAAAFLAALRAYVDQTAPKMTEWRNSEYNGQAYVKVTSAPGMGDGDLANLAIYYAVTPKSLVLTLSETVLKRTLDRQATREKPGATRPDLPSKPWLGTNLCLQVDRQFLNSIEGAARDSYQPAQQLLSWNNLPILNEWRRMDPTKDPMKLHQQFWQTKLICPGGGDYVWSEKWQTMESTVYGHPGEPKKGPGEILPLKKVASVNLGLSFETQGLSAKAVLERELKKTE